MRIVAGAAKGRRLRSPKGMTTRPLTSRAREALFSSLGDSIVDAKVLDAFAGSGSLGLEALSRGAAQVTFVERDRTALDALRANVDAVGLGGDVVGMSVEQYLTQGHRSDFSIAFLDPPYALATEDLDRMLELLAPLLDAGATVVVHRRVGTTEPHPPPVLHLRHERRYGDAQLLRFVKEEP